MTKKYVYGKPICTDAVLTKIEAEQGTVPYGKIATENGFEFAYQMDADDIVYGLGEANRGINKRGYCISVIVQMIRSIPKINVPSMRRTILSRSRERKRSDYFLIIRLRLHLILDIRK